MKPMAAEGHGGEDCGPDERVAQIGPGQGWDEIAIATTGLPWSASGPFLVRLRSFLADVLANLKFAQPLNHDGGDDESGEKSGEAGEGGAERQITEDAERRKVMKELQV